MIKEGDVFTVACISDTHILSTGDTVTFGPTVLGRLHFIEPGAYIELRPWRTYLSVAPQTLAESNDSGHIVPWHRIASMTEEPRVDPATLEPR